MKSSAFAIFLPVALFVGACSAKELSLHVRQSNWTIGQIVQTSSGPVVGHAAQNASGVSEYLGIPYAQPPLGNLRFAAPVSYAGNTTIDGSAFVRVYPAP